MMSTYSNTHDPEMNFSQGSSEWEYYINS